MAAQKAAAQATQKYVVHAQPQPAVEKQPVEQKQKVAAAPVQMTHKPTVVQH